MGDEADTGRRPPPCLDASLRCEAAKMMMSQSQMVAMEKRLSAPTLKCTSLSRILDGLRPLLLQREERKLHRVPVVPPGRIDRCYREELELDDLTHVPKRTGSRSAGQPNLVITMPYLVDELVVSRTGPRCIADRSSWYRGQKARISLKVQDVPGLKRLNSLFLRRESSCKRLFVHRRGCGELPGDSDSDNSRKIRLGKGCRGVPAIRTPARNAAVGCSSPVRPVRHRCHAADRRNDR